MKQYIKNLLSLFFKLYFKTYFISSKNYVSLSGIFFGAIHIKGVGNSLNLKGSNSINTSIIGSRNIINIYGGYSSKIKIVIRGSDNKLNIFNHRGIINTEFIFNGDFNNISIGSDTGIGGARFVVGESHNTISIGRNCMISDFIEIWATDTHDILNINNEIINSSASITIDDNVWIGTGAKILKGIVIGRGSIVGMGSTVVNSIPANCISVGNPNKVVKNNINWKI